MTKVNIDGSVLITGCKANIIGQINDSGGVFNLTDENGSRLYIDFCPTGERRLFYTIKNGSRKTDIEGCEGCKYHKGR